MSFKVTGASYTLESVTIGGGELILEDATTSIPSTYKSVTISEGGLIYAPTGNLSMNASAVKFDAVLSNTELKVTLSDEALNITRATFASYKITLGDNNIDFM